MQYRVRSQHPKVNQGNPWNVTLWYEDVAIAVKLKESFLRWSPGQHFWIEDEEGRAVPASLSVLR
jgi:hypothetical protein